MNLTRRKELRAKKSIRRRNPKRAKKRQEQAYGDKAKYIRSLPCCVCHKPGPSDPHHYPTRAAGGTSKDLVPLCREHHREFHDTGADTFQRRHYIDLKSRAERYEGWYHESPQPEDF